MLTNPRFYDLPVKPLIETELTERQIRAWASWSGMADLEQRTFLAQRGIFPMSGGGERVFAKTQAGLETTRGTIAAATRKVYGSGMMDKAQPLVRPEDEERGTLVKNYRATTGLIAAVLPFKASLTYEDLPWWSQLGFKGGVTGVLSALTVYTYTFVPTPTSDDLKTATFEWGDDTQSFVMPFGAMDQFDIEGGIGGLWTGTMNLVGSDMTQQAFTGAISDRTVEDIDMKLTKCAIGATGAVPSSYMTGRFISFKLHADNGLYRKYFADGATTAAKMSGLGRKKRSYDLEVVQEGLAATFTERGVFEAGTARVVRITSSGSVIAGSTGNVTRSADLIVPGRWAGFPVGKRETNTILTGKLEAEYDSVLAYDLSLAVANALSALP